MADPLPQEEGDTRQEEGDTRQEEGEIHALIPEIATASPECSGKSPTPEVDHLHTRLVANLGQQPACDTRLRTHRPNT